jgi:hypothetical protein
MSRLWGLLVISLFILILPAVGIAKDVSIMAFEGDWRGNAISENNVSVNFPITSRDIDVEIRPDTAGGFSITWRTLLRQKGNPSNPKEILKETTLTFVATDKPGVWKDSRGGNFYSGDTVSWAQIKNQTLTVYVLEMSETGDYDMQVYKRTLTGLNMELEFTAIRDGAVRRTAKGRLVLNSK